MANEPILYGPNGRLILQDGGTVDRPEWQIDIVTAKFKCRQSEVYKLIPEWGSPHPIWAALKKTTHKVSEPKGGWAEMDCTFKGLIDGKLPPMKEEAGLSLDSVQLSNSTNLDGLQGLGASTMEYEYYSPFTEFSYFMTTQPKGPRFDNRLIYIEDAFRIEKRNPPGGPNPYLIGGESYLAATVRGDDNTATGGSNRKYEVRDGEFNGIINLVTSGYKATPVCKGIWFVTETTAARIQPYGMTGRVMLSGLSGGSTNNDA